MGWSTGAYLSMITAYNDENAGHGGTDAPYFVDTSRYVEETVTFMTEAPCFGG